MKGTRSLIAGVVAGIALAAAAGTYAQPYGGMGHGSGPGMGMGMGHGSGPGMGMGMGHGSGSGMGMGHVHGPMGMGHGSGPGMGMGHVHGPMAGIDPAAMADAHLSALKAQLKITATQEAAWQTFATQAKQQAASMQAMRAKMLEGTGTAPERMEQHAAAMQQRTAGMATMTGAFGALYAVLTPEQKAIADQNVGMLGHRVRGFGRHFG